MLLYCLKRIVFLVMFLISALGLEAKSFEVSSPEGRISVNVRVSEKIYYSVYYGDEVLLADNSVSLQLRNKTLGDHPKLIKSGVSLVNENITPVVALKYEVVESKYNRLLLRFEDDYSLEFRIFDDGIAYRFITDIQGQIEVLNEEVVVGFPREYTVYIQQAGSFKTAYEEPYSSLKSESWHNDDIMSTLPVLLDTHKRYKILISESDLLDYPCLFFKGNGKGIYAEFPKCPMEFEAEGDRNVRILKEADYIAKTNGKRTFPWRYFVISEKDGDLIENTMTLKLAQSSIIKDPSWINPGQVSWEWWNGASPYGPDVNFVSGYNIETYKYFIDFAARFGIPYIIMDEGWANDNRNPFVPNPDIDLHELIRYGKDKGVDIILWLTWLTVENNFDLFRTFHEWGVAGVKIDFMDRSDQWMVNFYQRVASEAAKNELFVDFHGSFKPAGLEYLYPNVLTYEGVRGMEQMGGATPDNSLFFPFMRNAVGPMDYTPGAMISMQPEVYCSRRPNSASIGTRAYQMALFVVFESGLQMLADNPTLYYKNKECTDFITQVPVTWDETIALKAKLGEYAIVAKRKGNQWFIGGITNGGEDERSFEVPLDFLKKNKSYVMTAFEDGPNAKQQAMDYRKTTKEVRAGEVITVKMARNGGWTAIIE
jgi:alpha-glucosidase